MPFSFGLLIIFTMELDKLSLEFERALEDARHFAERRGEAFMTPVHLLHVMLHTNGALAAMALRS